MTLVVRQEVNDRQYQRGFSLIELLVVMLIIAVMAAGVSLTVSPQGSTAKQINQAGEKLFAQMNYALDEALVRNAAVGLDIEQSENDVDFSTSYRWKRHSSYDNDTGDPIFTAMEAPLGEHALPENLIWEIIIEDEGSLAESLDDLLNEDEDNPVPELIFEPSGETTGFSIVISLSEDALEDNPGAIDERYRILLNERGQLVRYKVGESEDP